MKSEIKFISPGLKVSIVLGLFATIVIVVLAVMYRAEFSIILLSAGGSILAFGGVVTLSRIYQLSHTKKLNFFELEEKKQHLRLTTYQANKAEFESRIIAIPSSQRVLMAENAPVRVIEATAGQYRVLADNTLQAAPVDLLQALDSEQRVLIKGASNSGKTNLLQWIAQKRLETGKVMVVDPHSYPQKWQGCQVVGQGSNHEQISVALDKLISLMLNRYQEISEGKVKEGEHSPITLVVDEWMSIAYECENAKQVMIRLVTESRKAGFSIFVGSHSDRIASLGLDGRGDLRDGFCLVRLAISNGQRTSTIDYGQGETPAILPGKFITSNQNVLETVEYINLEIQPTPGEAFILKLNADGESFNEIARQVYGSSGGKQVELIKKVIDKFSMYRVPA